MSVSLAPCMSNMGQVTARTFSAEFHLFSMLSARIEAMPPPV